MLKTLCRTLSLLATATAVAAPSAIASTLPELPLKKGQSAFTAGFVHAAYDNALSNNLSVGGTVGLPWATFALGGLNLAGRATYRMPDLANGIQWGISGGVSTFLGTANFGAAFLPGISVFAGPHVRAPLPITLPKGQSVIARGALNLSLNPGAPLAPIGGGIALEVAWRYSKNEEITVSNDGFIGYRRIL